MKAPEGYRLRPAREADAEALLHFGRRLLGETDFFLRGPEERGADAGEMARIIRAFADTPGALMLNAWTDGPTPEPVGEAVLMPGQLRRTRRTASVGVGVLKAHWGRGLARALMAAVEERALAAGLKRLELTVVRGNERARDLYRALGYESEGVKRRSVDLPARGLADEEMMAKLLRVVAQREGED